MGGSRMADERLLEVRRHTMRVKPGAHLSQAGVTLARRVGSDLGPFVRVITSTVPRAYETAIAMGWAVDEQLEALSLMGDAVDADIGAWDGGFAHWGAALARGGPAAQFAQAQATLWAAITMALPPGGAALVITHGGIIEAGAVACLPGADHLAWGPVCQYCEGVRLRWDGAAWRDATILRVGAA